MADVKAGYRMKPRSFSRVATQRKTLGSQMCDVSALTIFSWSKWGFDIFQFSTNGGSERRFSKGVAKLTYSFG